MAGEYPRKADVKEDAMTQALRLAAPVLLLLAVSGCADLNRTEQRVLSGGAIGAASGAAITAVTGGCVACGAAIGGAVGAAGGYVLDQVEGGKERDRRR